MHSARTDIVEFDRSTLRERLRSMPRLALGHFPTPVQELPRLRAALGGGPNVVMKRDDAISFAGGGNKVRKLELVAAAAMAAGADTLITAGGLQSNHARITAAVAARIGMDCVLVLNGTPQPRSTGNARLMELFGARMEYVSGRGQRTQRMEEVAGELSARGRRPFVIPLGASTPLGTLGFVLAVDELLAQIDAPDAIFVASSSGGTQAGICGGCTLARTRTRVIGVSADDPADDISRISRRLCVDALALIGLQTPPEAISLEVDDSFVGAGYGQATEASRHAAELVARTEGLVVDPVYTAKALACLISYVRQGRFSEDQTVLFWHTGGIPGLFA